MPDKKLCVIGIDQSYERFGVTVFGDGEMLCMRALELAREPSNSARREKVRAELESLFKRVYGAYSEVVVVIERIRLISDRFLNIDYIKSIGALISCVVDVAAKYGIKTYSVDTRCWKSSVIGTSKEQQNNMGINPKKYPTIQYIKRIGLEHKILIELSEKDRSKKGVFVRGGKRYKYNDDIADSYCIGKFYFVGDRGKLKLEQ